MKAVVLADTHIRADGRRRLPDAVYRELDDADLVLHAGDFVVPEVLDELSGFAPVHGVLGNNDLDLVLPHTLVLHLEGVTVGMIHDSGPTAGREGRMRRRFPGADLVVFGHSHAPVNDSFLFNPGSAVERRAQPVCTFGILEFDDGRVADRRIVAV